MKTIGRIDKADFPELHLEDLALKVDTGAYTSSIHCHDIRRVKEDDIEYIEFKLLDPSHPLYNNKVFKIKDFKEKKIKSSIGKKQKRFIIKTKIVIFGKKYKIELSLSDRSEMRFPILLGRKFLNKRFVVDTAQKNISFTLKNNKQNK